MVELKVRLGPKGQIVIPQIFRNFFKLLPGEEVIITIERDKGVLIRRRDENIAEKLKAIAKEASKHRKGKPFNYNKNEFYKQHEERARRAGIRI